MTCPARSTRLGRFTAPGPAAGSPFSREPATAAPAFRVGSPLAWIPYALCNRLHNPGHSTAAPTFARTRRPGDVMSPVSCRHLAQLRQDLVPEDVDPLALPLPDVVQRDLVETQLRVRGKLGGM